MDNNVRVTSAQIRPPAGLKACSRAQSTTCFNLIPIAHSASLIKELDLGLPALTFQQLSTDQATQKQVLELLQPNKLNELGIRLRDLIADRVFVDLGCGNPASSFMPRVIAQIFGAKTYVGVDLQLNNRYKVNREFKEFGDFTSHFLNTDIVPYLENARAKPGRGKVVFYLCGIESPLRNNREARPQIEAVCASILGNIEELTVNGDGVVLGPKTNGFQPEHYGFTCIHGTKKNPTGYINLDIADKLPRQRSGSVEWVSLDDYKAVGIDPLYDDYFHSIFVKS